MVAEICNSALIFRALGPNTASYAQETSLKIFIPNVVQKLTKININIHSLMIGSVPVPYHILNKIRGFWWLYSCSHLFEYDAMSYYIQNKF